LAQELARDTQVILVGDAACLREPGRLGDSVMSLQVEPRQRCAKSIIGKQQNAAPALPEVVNCSNISEILPIA